MAKMYSVPKPFEAIIVSLFFHLKTLFTEVRVLELENEKVYSLAIWRHHSVIFSFVYIYLSKLKMLAC